MSVIVCGGVWAAHPASHLAGRRQPFADPPVLRFIGHSTCGTICDPDHLRETDLKPPAFPSRWRVGRAATRDKNRGQISNDITVQSGTM